MRFMQNSPPVMQFVARRGEEWVCASVALGRPYNGGKLVETTLDFESELTGADDDSFRYPLSNWLSGLTSGALYAFRTLQVPRRHLLISRMAGSLGADGVQALAEGAASAVARLLDRELPATDADGWRIELE